MKSNSNSKLNNLSKEDLELFKRLHDEYEDIRSSSFDVANEIERLEHKRLQLTERLVSLNFEEIEAYQRLSKDNDIPLSDVKSAIMDVILNLKQS